MVLVPLNCLFKSYLCTKLNQLLAYMLVDDWYNIWNTLKKSSVIFNGRNKKAYPFHVLRFYAAAPSNTAIEFFLEWNEVMCGRDPSIEKQKASLSLLYMTADRPMGVLHFSPLYTSTCIILNVSR